MVDPPWAAILTFVGVTLAGLTLLTFVTQGTALALMGVSQLLYVVPMLVIAKSKGRPVLFKVTLIGAGLVFLINAACIGYFVVFWRY